MAQLDITKQSNIFITRKINKLVSKYADLDNPKEYHSSEMPDTLVITPKQLEYLLKHNGIEVFLETEDNPEEYLFHTPFNVMEIIICNANEKGITI